MFVLTKLWNAFAHLTTNLVQLSETVGETNTLLRRQLRLDRVEEEVEFIDPVVPVLENKTGKRGKRR